MVGRTVGPYGRSNTAEHRKQVDKGSKKTARARQRATVGDVIQIYAARIFLANPWPVLPPHGPNTARLVSEIQARPRGNLRFVVCGKGTRPD